jgi:hypothetical protein
MPGRDTGYGEAAALPKKFGAGLSGSFAMAMPCSGHPAPGQSSSGQDGRGALEDVAEGQAVP